MTALDYFSYKKRQKFRRTKFNLCSIKPPPPGLYFHVKPSLLATTFITLRDQTSMTLGLANLKFSHQTDFMVRLIEFLGLHVLGITPCIGNILSNYRYSDSDICF